MHEEERYTAAPNDGSYAALQAFLEQWLEGTVSFRVQNRVMVAADEIWSNIVHYSGASQASVALWQEGDALCLRFTDDGVPYDPTAVPEPDTTLPADAREFGGLGLHMVRKLTAAMTYCRSGSENSLTLEFRLT